MTVWRCSGPEKLFECRTTSLFGCKPIIMLHVWVNEYMTWLILKPAKQDSRRLLSPTVLLSIPGFSVISSCGVSLRSRCLLAVRVDTSPSSGTWWNPRVNDRQRSFWVSAVSRPVSPLNEAQDVWIRFRTGFVCLWADCSDAHCVRLKAVRASC